MSCMKGSDDGERGVIIGTGLIARGFAPYLSGLSGTCIYAAGVSNSACNDPREFEREQQRATEALTAIPVSSLFIYFSTCGVDDPAGFSKGWEIDASV